MYIKSICLVVVMAACCYGQEHTEEMFPFTIGHGTCSCDAKTRVHRVRLPQLYPGFTSTLSLAQWDKHVAGKEWSGVYEINLRSSTASKAKQQFGFKALFQRKDRRGNYPKSMAYSENMYVKGKCNKKDIKMKPVSRNLAVFELVGQKATRRSAFDIIFSSCPDQYIWVYTCFDYSALRTDSCPSDKTTIMLMVPQHHSSMDDLPLRQIEDDLRQETDFTLRLCQSSNFKSYFIYENNGCSVVKPKLMVKEVPVDSPPDKVKQPRKDAQSNVQLDAEAFTNDVHQLHIPSALPNDFSLFDLPDLLFLESLGNSKIHAKLNAQPSQSKVLADHSVETQVIHNRQVNENSPKPDILTDAPVKVLGAPAVSSNTPPVQSESAYTQPLQSEPGVPAVPAAA